MRSSEFIDEGIGDWFAKKGFLGTERQIDAVAKQKSDYAQKAGQQAFASVFSKALVNGENGGQIKVGSSTTGMELKDFVKMYIDSLTKNLTIPAGIDFTPLITEFVSSYRGGGKLPPAAAKIFATINTIKSLQQKTSSSRDTAVPPPDKDISVSAPYSPSSSTSKTYEYTYDSTKDEWTRWPKGQAGKPGVRAEIIANTHRDYTKLNSNYDKDSL